MKTSHLLVSTLAMLALDVFGGASVAYENPVYPHDSPDPTLWQDEAGNWYLASSGHNVKTSRDLVRWQETPHAILSDADMAWVRRDWGEVWAPDVIRIGEWYLAYLTFYRDGEHTAIYRFRSHCPTGPFQEPEMLVSSAGDQMREVIDAEVATDPKDGTWLYFGHGDVRRVRLTDDGLKRAPGAKIEHVAGLSLGSPDDSGLNGWFANSTEGSYLYRRGDWWYLFVSEGNWMNDTYRLAVGRSRSLAGEFFDREGRPMKAGAATPVLSSGRDDEFFGPGHNGDVVVSPSGRTYVFYHCHWKGSPWYEYSVVWNQVYFPRPLMLQELLWTEDGWPYFGNGGKPQKQCVFE